MNSPPKRFGTECSKYTNAGNFDTPYCSAASRSYNIHLKINANTYHLSIKIINNG